MDKGVSPLVSGFSSHPLPRPSAPYWTVWRLRTLRWLALPLAAFSPAYSIQAEHIDQVTASQGQLDKAAREWHRGNFDSALSIWRTLALQDDRSAWFNLGQAWRLGRGVPTDIDAAIAAYKVSARLGYERARNQLALVLYMVPEHRKEALPLLLAAADAGNTQAAFLIAQAEMAGSDFPADRRRAAYHFSVAARGGIGAAWGPLVLLRAEFPDMDVPPAIKSVLKPDQAPPAQSVSLAKRAVPLATEKSPLLINMTMPRAKSLNELMADISNQTGVPVVYRLDEKDAYKQDDVSHRLRISWNGPVEPVLSKIAQVFDIRIATEAGAMMVQSKHKSAI